MTFFIAHRINTIEALKNVPTNFGVEIDIRDSPCGIHLVHDPFQIGEDFETYLGHFKHKFLVLNIKSERTEIKTLQLLEQFKISNYFFLDSSFPMIYLMAKEGQKKIALRFSEFEGLDTILAMRGKIDWVWVDCFSKLPITKESYKILKDEGFKLCLVSPELQLQPEKLFTYKNYIQENQIYFDAICSKLHKIDSWME